MFIRFIKKILAVRREKQLKVVLDTLKALKETHQDGLDKCGNHIRAYLYREIGHLWLDDGSVEGANMAINSGLVDKINRTSGRHNLTFVRINDRGLAYLENNTIHA